MNLSLFITKCCSINGIFQESLLLQQDNEGVPDKETIISALMVHLKKAYKYSICEWEPSDIAYPRYMLLGGDKRILAYIVFNYYEGDFFDNKVLNLSLNEVIRTVSYAESRLDRPIFYINLLNYKDVSGLFFETNEQIKDRLYNDNDCLDRQKEIYIPDITKMGNFGNLVITWDNLKKNSVHQS